MIKYLLEKGADVNVKRDIDSKTPLHFITDSDYTEVQVLKWTKFLLDAKADPNYLDKSDQSPLHYALLYNRFDVFNLLLEHGAHLNFGKSLFIAASNSSQSHSSHAEPNPRLPIIVKRLLQLRVPLPVTILKSENWDFSSIFYKVILPTRDEVDWKTDLLVDDYRFDDTMTMKEAIMAKGPKIFQTFLELQF